MANGLKEMLNYFFTPMTGIIFNNRGTIDKYVGDMIMAFWGAPLIDEHHRANGIKAALQMLAKVEQMRPELEERGWPEINIGIGLNTGMMNVGDMGSNYRRAYTVIGDAVNLGSRLEGLTKFYGVGLIVNDTTQAGQDDYVFRILDKVKVKGKNEAVTIYQPVGHVDDVDSAMHEELKEYMDALETYWHQDWFNAEQKFMVLQAKFPGTKVYSLYLERIADLRNQGLPEDWDGVFVHTSK